jgi:hypothetical protein
MEIYKHILKLADRVCMPHINTTGNIVLEVLVNRINRRKK